jgi:HEAT repeat protein
MPALQDANAAVVMAAARALGAMGRLENPEPLRQLLASANEAVRVEAATALAQLDDPSGPAALERLAYSRDPRIRRQVATAMGQVANPMFAATLVRLLDDQYAIRLAALESLPKVAGPRSGDADDHPSGNVAEQVKFWKERAADRR